jgi:hypothetical protein
MDDIKKSLASALALPAKISQFKLIPFPCMILYCLLLTAIYNYNNIYLEKSVCTLAKHKQNSTSKS